jgi:hypothetical protein
MPQKTITYGEGTVSCCAAGGRAGWLCVEAGALELVNGGLGAALAGSYALCMTEKLRSEVLALPAAERADLAHALLQSLHEEADLGAESAWLTELDRREARTPR